jgi:hypothetical protein
VIDIKGIGFTATSSVQFNGTPASVTYIGSGEVKATAPAGATSGQLGLTTVNPHRNFVLETR